VIDPKREATAVHEAVKLHIPVIALANTDCDVSVITCPIPANDANIKSIAFFVNRIVEAYKKGAAASVKKKATPAEKEKK
jgi:small subunit ribosomal protein S2